MLLVKNVVYFQLLKTFSVCFTYRQNRYFLVDSFLTRTGSVFQILIFSETEIVNIIKVTVGVKKIKREIAMQKIVINFAKFRKLIIKEIMI